MYSKIGIVLVLAMYVLSGINKFLDFDGTVSITQQKFPIKFPKWFFSCNSVKKSENKTKINLLRISEKNPDLRRA